MNTGSRSFRVFETICEELVTRLSGDTSPQAKHFTAQAHELLFTIDSWRQEVPTQDQRSAVIARVLDLHRVVLEHLTTGAAKPPHM